jgi:hypothetical protein
MKNRKRTISAGGSCEASGSGEAGSSGNAKVSMRKRSKTGN